MNKGYIAALGSALFLSLTAIFIRYLTLEYNLPALVLVYWREEFVALSLLLIFLLFKRECLYGGLNGQIIFLVGYGAVLALFNAIWTFSVNLNGAAVATVLIYSSAAFSTVLGWSILKEKISIKKMLVVAMSLLGCMLVVNIFNLSAKVLNIEGIFVGMAAGLCYSIYGIMGRAAAERGLDTWITLLYIFAFASLMMLALNLVAGKNVPGGAVKPADIFWLGKSWRGWMMLAALAVGPTLLGFGLYNVSLRYLPSSTANLVVIIEPVFTAVTAFFLFGEVLTKSQIAGAALIISAVAILHMKN
ncbi:MAG: EamA family transporter [Anaerolineaceae bacterium]|nr:EamA family transporter [Anaerolineaceae bacterium]